MDALSVNQCMVVNFTDVNGAHMPIWRATKMPTEIAGVDNEDLAQPVLFHKLLWNAVVNHYVSW
jgi:hypothetical protein